MRVSEADSKSGLKSEKAIGALASSLRPRSLGSVGALILEKVPSKDVEGNFKASVWANG